MEEETAPKPNISEAISDPLPTFDHQGVIIEPFDNEARRDTEFQDSECMHAVGVVGAVYSCFLLNTLRPELSGMLIELVLEFHAWSTSRPTQESDATADRLEKEINVVMELEKEQGRSSNPLHVTLVGRPKSSIPLGDILDPVRCSTDTDPGCF